MGLHGGRLVAALLALLLVVFRRAAFDTVEMLNGYGSKVACSLHFLQRRPLGSIRWQELSWPPIAPFVALSANETCVDSRVWFAPWIGQRSACLHARGELGCALVHRNKTYLDYLDADLLRQDLKSAKESPFADFAKLDIDASLDKHPLVEDHFSNFYISSRALLVIDASTHPARVLVERYGEGYNRSDVHAGWSMTKSVLALWVGSLLETGDTSIFPERLSTKIHQNVTLEDLLRMRDSFDWDEIYGPGGNPVEMLFHGEEVGIAPMKARSASGCFQYSSKSTNIISRYLKNRLGDKYLNDLFERLIRRVGAKSTRVETDPSGVFVGSSFSLMTALDWARLGVLVANKGLWPATHSRIIGEDFIERTRIPTDTARGVYGMHFWLGGNDPGEANAETNACDEAFPTRVTSMRDWYAKLPKGTLMMTGFEGQYVIVHPESKLVVVRLGASREKCPVWPVFKPGEIFPPLFDHLLKSRGYNTN